MQNVSYAGVYICDFLKVTLSLYIHLRIISHVYNYASSCLYVTLKCA